MCRNQGQSWLSLRGRATLFSRKHLCLPGGTGWGVRGGLKNTPKLHPCPSIHGIQQKRHGLRLQLRTFCSKHSSTFFFRTPHSLTHPPPHPTPPSPSIPLCHTERETRTAAVEAREQDFLSLNWWWVVGGGADGGVGWGVRGGAVYAVIAAVYSRDHMTSHRRMQSKRSPGQLLLLLLGPLHPPLSAGEGGAGRG